MLTACCNTTPVETSAVETPQVQMHVSINVKVRVTQEADASGVLAEAPGPVSELVRTGCTPASLAGLATSIHVEVVRPGGGPRA